VPFTLAGPGHEEPEVGVVRAAGPDLLAGDGPAPVDWCRPGGEPGEVGAGAGLGEELAPDLVAPEDGGEEALLLLERSVPPEHRSDELEADDIELPRQPRPGHLLGEDRLLDEAGPGAAVLTGPRQACPTGVEEDPLPGPGGVDVVERGRRPVVPQARGNRDSRQPGEQAIPEVAFVDRQRQVHVSPSPPIILIIVMNSVSIALD
jgi:hypothetical protein